MKIYKMLQQGYRERTVSRTQVGCKNEVISI